MTVKTTVTEEVEYGIEAKITYRASRNRIMREVRVRSGREIPGFGEWQTVSEGPIDASEVPASTKEELLAKAKEEQDEAVEKARQTRQTLRGVE